MQEGESLRLVGERIKHARNEQERTQAELALLLGLTEEEVDRLEQGGANLELHTLFKLSEALGYSILYFFGIESDELNLLDLYRAIPPGLPRIYILKFLESWAAGKGKIE